MDNRETRTYRMKDFFGENVDSGILKFLQSGRTVHEQRFTNGRANVTIPDNVPPGLYDVVSSRDDGAVYTVSDVFIAFSPHYYRHAQLHGDLKLLGGNFSGDPIESTKVHSDFYTYLAQQGNLKEALDRVAQYYSPTGLRWGGSIHLGEKIEVDKGEMVYEGNVYSWETTHLDYPEVGTYQLGITEGELTIDESVEYPFATIYKDANDWVYIDKNLGYIPQERNGELFYFTGYEKTVYDVDISFDAPELLQGRVYDDIVYGPAEIGVKDRVRLDFAGTGPVFEFGRLYVYATENYFILFQEDTILTALPRFTNSGIELDARKGLIFTSYGDGGSVHWRGYVPYEEATLRFLQGDPVVEYQRDLRRDTLGIIPLATVIEDWDVIQNGSATIT